MKERVPRQLPKRGFSRNVPDSPNQKSTRSWGPEFGEPLWPQDAERRSRQSTRSWGPKFGEPLWPQDEKRNRSFRRPFTNDLPNRDAQPEIPWEELVKGDRSDIAAGHRYLCDPVARAKHEAYMSGKPLTEVESEGESEQPEVLQRKADSSEVEEGRSEETSIQAKCDCEQKEEAVNLKADSPAPTTSESDSEEEINLKADTPPVEDPQKEVNLKAETPTPTASEQDSEEEISLKADSPGSTASEPDSEEEINLKAESSQVEDSSEEANLSQAGIQTKLKIGQPGDKYEQEADAKAAEVMKMEDPAASPEVEEESSDNAIQKQAIAETITPLVQRKGNQENGNGAKIEGKLGQGGGQPLGQETRSFMESRFGADFSGVRVHTDSAAVQMNKDLGAQAFTHGQDIYYGKGKSPGKDELTAHELTHTIQQSGGTLQPRAISSGSIEEAKKKDGVPETERTEKDATDQVESFGQTQTPTTPQSQEDSESSDRGQESDCQADAAPGQAETAKQDAQKAIEEATPTKEGVAEKEVAESEDKEAAEQEGEAKGQEGTTPGDSPPVDGAEGEGNVREAAVTELVAREEETASEEAEASAAVEETRTEMGTAASGSQQLASADLGLAQPPVKPTFVTTEEGIGTLQPEQVLGETGEGMVVYQTDNPAESLALGDRGIFVRPIPEQVVAGSMDEQRDRSEAALSQFMASSTERKAGISEMGQTIQPRIQAAAEQARASVEAAIAQNQSAIANSIAQARTQVQTQAQSAKSQITGQHGTALAAIRSSTASARQRLQAEYQTQLAQLAETEGGMAARINEPFDKAALDFRNAGETVGAEALTIGTEYAGTYANESPPEPSNAITEFLESFDRDTYVQNWRQAKIDAATGLAQNYRDGLVQDANEKAGQLSQNQPPVLEGMQSVVAQTRSSLEAKYNSALQQLEGAEQQALQAADATLQSQLQGIDQNLNSNLASLEQMQGTQLQQLQTTGEQQKLAITCNAQQATAALQQSVNQASENLQGAFDAFADQARGMETPNLQAIESVIAEANGELNNITATTRTELEAGIENSAQGIVQQGQQTAQSLNAIAQQAATSSTAVGQEFSTSTAQVVQSASQAFAQLQTGHTQTVNTTAEQTTGEFQQMTAEVGQKLEGVIQSLNQKLGESAGQLEGGLRGSLSNLRAEIPTKAKEAADQVQPAWKSVLKVVIDVVVTVAVTVAIVALAASGVGLVAAIGLAALIGAAGGLVKQGLNDLVDDKASSWVDYAKAGGFGAASGVLQLVGLRGADKLAGMLTSKVTQNIVRVGVESLADTAVDITERLGAGEQFSLAMVGKSFGSSLLGNVGGQALTGSFGKLGRKLGVDKIDNKAFKAGSEFATDTISDTATDVTSQVVFEGKELSWATVGESAGTSALGNLTSKGANRVYGDRIGSWGKPKTTSPDAPNGGLSDGSTGITLKKPSILDSQGRPIGEKPAPVNLVDSQGRPMGEKPAPVNLVDSQGRPIKQDAQQSPNLTKTKPKNQDTDPVLSAALPRDLQGKVPIHVDPALSGNTVRVHYEVDANGLVTNIHMRTGPDASAVDIQLHGQTVRLMQQYSGFSGRIRLLKEKLQSWISKNGEPPVGSRAWEAKLEVEKLPRIIDERLDRLSRGGLDADAQAQLHADIESLQQQLDQHQRTLDEMEADPGVGFVAAEDFGKYLKDKIGDPPSDMQDPHAHHILYKKGKGETQQKLVQEGQAILRKHGIDPIWGLENLTWAPNRVKGQHNGETVQALVDELKAVDDAGLGRDDIVNTLKKYGKKAADRGKND